MQGHVTAGALVALILLSGAASAAWRQAGGGPGHPGIVEGLPETLDVLEVRFAEDRVSTQAFGPGAVETPAGLAFAWRGSSGLSDCHLDILPSRSAPVRTTAVQCESIVTLVGYDDATGLVVLCTPTVSGAPLIQAFDPVSLERRWSYTIEEPAVAPPGGSNIYTAWRCDGSAIDVEERRVIALFARSGDARSEISALGLDDGSVAWRTPLTLTSRILAPLGVSDPSPGAGFVARSVTRTESGFLVVGLTPTELGPVEAAYIALDRAGAFQSVYAVPIDGNVDPRLHSAAATASGRVAMLAMGNAILAVDPTVTDATSTPFHPGSAPSDQDDIFRMAAPAWWPEANALLVPSFGGISAFRTPGMAHLWNWSAGPGARTTQVVIAPPGDAYVLAKRTETADDVLTLSRLDVRSGAELQRLRFDGPELLNFTQSSRFVPWSSEGLAVVVKPNGHMLLLGEAPDVDRPRASPSTFYPPVDRPVELRIEAAGARTILTAWGDDTIVESEPGAPLRYQYGDVRDRHVRVTASYPDGRTATSTLILHVGQPDPGALTPLQRALRPENQNFTFFLLGLAVTGGGVLFATLLRRQRHSRLAKEEALLGKVIDASLLNPTTGLAALEAHRAHLKDQHTRRRLDDAQYGLLDHRTVRAMKSARYRLLGAALNKLSPHFRRLLDTALEDGQVTPGEMAALVQALEDERALSDAERERMRALLAGWAR